MTHERLARTDRIRAIGSVAPSEEHSLKRLFEDVPIGLLELDMDTMPPTIVAANERATAFLGFEPEEIVGQSIERLLPVSSARHPMLRFDELDSDESRRFETSLVRSDGGRFPARAQLIAVDGVDSRRAMFAIEDISTELRARSRLAAIDEERRRIAHELHDTLAQNLAAIRLNAAVWLHMIDDDPEELRSELRALQNDLKLEIEATRRSIYALRPAELDEAGFRVALRELIDGLAERYRFEVDLKTIGSLDHIPRELELPLLRMVQEALNNVGQHASADHVRLMFEIDRRSRLTVMIGDDGSGFEASALSDARSAGHLGLVQMVERVESYGGSLTVESTPGSGTRLRIEIPLISA